MPATRRTSSRCSTIPEQAARLRFVRGDIADPVTVGELVGEADAVLNFAAETHVDRSILEPQAFLVTNVIGVHTLLEAIRAQDRQEPEDPLRPGLDGRGLRLDPRGALGRGRPAPPALAVRRLEGGRGAARAELSRHLRRGRGGHPRLEHVRPLSTTPRSSSRCSSRTRSTTGRCRSTGTASSGGTGCTSPTTPRRSISCSAMALRARRTTSRAGPS